MDDEYLTRCVVDPLKRKLYLYSSEGDEKTVDCETVDQFMNMLRFVRDTATDDVVSYVNPLLTEYEGNSRYDYPDPNFSEDSDIPLEERNYTDPQYRFPRNTITG